MKIILPTELIDHLYQRFSDSPGHYYIKDLQGRYLFCNVNQARSAGFDRIHKLIGKTDFNTPWRHQAKTLTTNDNQVCKQQRSLSFYESAELIDGSYTTALSEKQPFYIKHKLIGICGTSIMLPNYHNQSGFFHRITGEPLQLSHKQQQCLEQLLEGKTAKQIGSILDISPRTVEDHLGAIRRKHQFRTNRQMVGMINTISHA